jgi:DNA-nicking Smr family endonuclease
MDKTEEIDIHGLTVTEAVLELNHFLEYVPEIRAKSWSYTDTGRGKIF